MTDAATPPQLTAFFRLGRYLLKPSLDQVTQSQQLYDRNLVGSKACGLVALPLAWTPPFVVLSAELYRDWLAALRPEGMLREVGHQIVDCCSSWQKLWPRGLILRSSAVSETLRDRGAYKSYELPADFSPDSIGTVIHQIYDSFETEGGDGDMAVVVQALAGGDVRGHVSNELRVAISINHWMWEIEVPSPAADRFNSQRSEMPDVSVPLKVKSETTKNLTIVLKSVCRWVTTKHGRRSHLEWGLVSGNLWLFQIDFEDDFADTGCDPRTLLRETDSRPAGKPRSGSPWKRVDPKTQTGWSKIDKIKLFIEERTDPYPSLYYLTAEEALEAISGGYDLAADIEQITHGRAVCRTDCTSPHVDKLNLPRTESVSSARAVEFIVDTASKLRTRGASDSEICFILHKFIPARVAAWAVARPDQQIVLVDTLWGLPDGLQFLPHDTFEFDVRRNATSSEYIAYKPQFLQEMPDGEWSLVQVNRKFTRSRSLGLHHLRRVATDTKRIVQKLNRPIQIMWFCDVAEEANVGQDVPWFMMNPEPSHQSASSSLAPGLRKIVIKNFGDLENVKKSAQDKVVLVLQPQAELYRDDEFLKAVVEAASILEAPVLLTGSVLGHAFYMLQRAGISVRTQAPSHSRVRQKQTFRKLVRDEIPSRILGHGERVEQARIDKAESRAALVIKLFEEGQELLNARSPDEVTAELADLTEVLRALCSATGVDWQAVQVAAEEKRRARGSFEQNVVLMETSSPRWKDQNETIEAKVIPLSALGLVTSKGKEHVINFSAAAAKGADNLVNLTSGAKITVSITRDGIRIVEHDAMSDSDGQLNFPF